MNLLDKHPDFIWFPCSKWERQEDEGAGNHFNCPIVASYPEALRLNIDELRTSDVELLTPWLPYDQKEHLKKRLFVELVEAHPELMGKARRAHAGRDRRRRGRRVGRGRGVQARHPREGRGDAAPGWRPRARTASCWPGRPYHNDPEINHAIPELLTSFGLAVLTEDSIAHLGTLERPIRLVDQWMYHTRLYAAAKVATERRRPRPRPAEQLRLRPRRADHRPGAGDPRARGQGVHRAQDRRGVQPGRGAHPRAHACLAALKDQADEQAEATARACGCPAACPEFPPRPSMPGG